MIADVISQLEQREGLLPLSIEDRPRLAALLAAYPELTGAIREAHVLASRHFPADGEVRLRAVTYTDTPEDGEQLVVEVRTGLPFDEWRRRLDRLDEAWMQGRADVFALPMLITVASRPARS
jgi:hypothetical protein